LFANVITL